MSNPSGASALPDYQVPFPATCCGEGQLNVSEIKFQGIVESSLRRIGVFHPVQTKRDEQHYPGRKIKRNAILK